MRTHTVMFSKVKTVYCWVQRQFSQLFLCHGCSSCPVVDFNQSNLKKWTAILLFIIIKIYILIFLWLSLVKDDTHNRDKWIDLTTENCLTLPHCGIKGVILYELILVTLNDSSSSSSTIYYYWASSVLTELFSSVLTELVRPARLSHKRTPSDWAG